MISKGLLADFLTLEDLELHEGIQKDLDDIDLPGGFRNDFVFPGRLIKDRFLNYLQLPFNEISPRFPKNLEEFRGI
jgi:hypothetical protein